MTDEPSGRQEAPAGAPPSDPAALREDIEQTRQEIGDTVEALAAKADVRGRVRQKAADTAEQAKQKVAEAAEAARTKAQVLKEQAVARTAVVRENVAETPPRHVVGQVTSTARAWRGPLVLAGGTVAVLAAWLRRRRGSRARRR